MGGQAQIIVEARIISLFLRIVPDVQIRKYPKSPGHEGSPKPGYSLEPETGRNQDRQVNILPLLCCPTGNHSAARNACHCHVIPQAASDIRNVVTVTNEFLGSQLLMLSIHAIRQSMIGQGHDKSVVASV